MLPTGHRRLSLKAVNLAFCGNTEQKVLGRTGDNICIDWGYLHLIHKDARFIQRGIDLYKCRFVMSEADTKKTYNAFNEAVVMAVVTEEMSGVIAIAYDDIKSIEYFGTHLDDFYKESDGSFNNMVKKAVSQYREIKKNAFYFQRSLVKKHSKVSTEYEKLFH